MLLGAHTTSDGLSLGSTEEQGLSGASFVHPPTTTADPYQMCGVCGRLPSRHSFRRRPRCAPAIAKAKLTSASGPLPPLAKPSLAPVHTNISAHNCMSWFQLRLLHVECVYGFCARLHVHPSSPCAGGHASLRVLVCCGVGNWHFYTQAVSNLSRVACLHIAIHGTLPQPDEVNQILLCFFDLIFEISLCLGTLGSYRPPLH